MGAATPAVSADLGNACPAWRGARGCPRRAAAITRKCAADGRGRRLRARLADAGRHHPPRRRVLTAAGVPAPIDALDLPSRSIASLSFACRRCPAPTRRPMPNTVQDNSGATPRSPPMDGRRLLVRTLRLRDTGRDRGRHTRGRSLHPLCAEAVRARRALRRARRWPHGPRAGRRRAGLVSNSRLLGAPSEIKRLSGV